LQWVASLDDSLFRFPLTLLIVVFCVGIAFWV
jgi:hypothetical protein